MRRDKPEFPPLLAGGFHEFDLAELQRRCVDDFPLSTNRADLLDGLKRLLREFRRLHIECEAWIDGSFLTEKIDPGDVDAVFHFRSDAVDTLNPYQGDFLLRIANENAQIKAEYGCDAYLGIEGGLVGETGLEARVYWERQFGLWGGSLTKGIAILRLGAS